MLKVNNTKLKLFLVIVLSTVIFLIYPHRVVFASILFQDDFEGQNYNKWTVVTGNQNWSIQNIQNSYRFGGTVPTPSTGIEAEAGDFSWTNYKFSVDLLP